MKKIDVSQKGEIQLMRQRITKYQGEGSAMLVMTLMLMVTGK